MGSLQRLLFRGHGIGRRGGQRRLRQTNGVDTAAERVATAGGSAGAHATCSGEGCARRFARRRTGITLKTAARKIHAGQCNRMLIDTSSSER